MFGKKDKMGLGFSFTPSGIVRLLADDECLFVRFWQSLHVDLYGSVARKSSQSFSQFAYRHADSVSPAGSHLFVPSGDSGEAERSFRMEAERHSGMNTIGA